jgi:peptide/nickel transport system permease protein
MATPQAVIDISELDQLKKPLRTRLAQVCRRQPLATAGALIVIIMVLAAVFANVISPYDPVANDLEHMLEPPSALHWMGTDEFGRDILTRVIYGARTALSIGLTAAFFGATGGLILGVASAYFGGILDLVIQRIVDVVMAFPLIIMALAVVATLGPGTQNVIIAITIPFIPNCARVVRSSSLALRDIPYVDAARALGYGHTRIILRHMVPNVMAPYLIMLSAFVGQAILLEAVLSYLGMGVQDPTPAWGLMLKGGAEEFLESAPWVSIFPGIAISLAVFGFNLFGDGLRDVLDPKLRRQ